MYSKFALSLATSLILGLAGSAAHAFEHPSAGQPINEAMLEITYAGDSLKSADLSINDIIFSDASQYPDVSDLSHAEKYMLAGVSSTPWKEGIHLHPWSLDIYFLYSKFHQHGIPLPGELGYEVIRQLPGYAHYSKQQLDVFRNPLTGEWPVLDDASGLPGSVYIHVPTDEEKYHLAIRDENFKKVLYLNSFTSKDPPYREQREPNGPPLYMRIMGLSGKPILEFLWAW